MYKWFLAAAAVCLMGTSAVAAAEDSYYLELPTKGITSHERSPSMCRMKTRLSTA